MFENCEKQLRSIVPTPKKIERAEGYRGVPCTVTAAHAPFATAAETFCASATKILEKEFSVTEDGGIVLCHDASLPANAYTVDTRDEQAIVLTASSEEGIFYATVTLLHLIAEEKNGELSLVKALIEDAPDKDYRTLMVDLAREWHPAHTVLHYIDVCYMMKVRYLHLHLIDDQRYTLPSRAFPDVTKYNRHYTFEDIERFREYANARGVILVPELEVPGHAAMLVRAYPEIFALHSDGTNDASLVTEEGLVITAKNIICAGSEKANEAIRTMIREICEIFPETPYIHIGGDEANIKAWNGCTECVRYMKEHGIADEYELYSEFTGRVAQMVLDCGKTPIVWEGFPKSGVHHIPKETIVIAWESHYHMAYDLLDAGFRIINGSWQPLYIVNSYRLRWHAPDILNWNVYNWQHWWEHSEAKLNPIHVRPTDRVLGAQISSWQCTYEQEINGILENLATLSEQTWNVRRVCDTEAFTRRLTLYLQRIARLIQDV